ncbi:MAG TPA: class I SAM-dependent methyltransferase [Daejeonella sp.]|uniref:class I SAM-dependent methyltransferase n=1 Tax=Daejeonella sp. TaxID=2805397 RepID=UPI002EDB8935
MGAQHSNLRNLWDKSFMAKGHTGYTDPLKHSYDQPIRLAAVSRILARLFPNAGLSGKNALDIGCGTGDFIKLQRQNGMFVTGLDISPKVIEATRQRFQNDEKVELISGPVVNVNLKDDFYDLVTSITVLQHILEEDELIQSLKLIGKSMKTEGILIVLELAPPHKDSIIHYNDGIPYLIERPANTWKLLFNKAGFDLIEEPVMPQLGIAMLRGFGSIFEKIGQRKNNLGVSPPNPNNDSTKNAGSAINKPSFFQKIKYKGFVSIRKLLLLISHPFDHTFHLPFPSAPNRHYHIFVYKFKRH